MPLRQARHSGSLLCRIWALCTAPLSHIEVHMEQVYQHFALESLLEGIPTIMLAFVWLYATSSSKGCIFATCRPSAISSNFPNHSHTLPMSPREMLSEEVAALQSGQCTALPLTSDGWFTMDWTPRNAVIHWQENTQHFLYRPVEFELKGMLRSASTHTRATACRLDLLHALSWLTMATDYRNKAAQCILQLKGQLLLCWCEDSTLKKLAGPARGASAAGSMDSSV